MRRVFTTVIFFGCLSFSFAQGIQGKVVLSGQTIVVTGHSVTLAWTASQGATGYNAYRGTTSGGPYSKMAAAIVGTTYEDNQVTHKQTFYYVITAVAGSSESGYSNEVTAVIP
jgi:cellulose 1,4-beta-cellobiosidase